MKVEIRNYIKNGKDDPNKKIGLSEFCQVNIIDFYTYITKVISAFENDPYQMEIIKISDQDKIIIYNSNKFDDYYINSINSFAILDYALTISKGKKSITCIPKNNKEISLLDNDMKISINNKLLAKFPYLEDIVLDLINYKYEMAFDNKEINYKYLEDNIYITYNEKIDKNRSTLKEKLSYNQKEIIDEETKRLIFYIKGMQVDVKTKKLLINSIKTIMNKEGE